MRAHCPWAWKPGERPKRQGELDDGTWRLSRLRGAPRLATRRLGLRHLSSPLQIGPWRDLKAVVLAPRADTA